MRRSLQLAAFCTILAVTSVSTFAQDRPLVGTVIDVDEGRRRLQVELDAEPGSRITIETDAVSTVYHGFGTVIGDQPEIFVGYSGLANVRLGDRIQVRGTTEAEGLVRARQVTLLGRAVEAPQVGVGQTRSPTSVATPTVPPPATAGGSAVEGTIRQINDAEGRIVIQTADRRMITIRTFRNTPVRYQGQVYRTTNLEVGDRIRVEAEPRDAQSDEITARGIEVTKSVQEAAAAGPGGTITVLEGRLTRIEQDLDYVYVEQPRGEIRVDMRQAEDAQGEILRARDLRAGDVVEISGSYNRVGDLFMASTVRFPAGGGPGSGRDAEPFVRYSVVTLTGSIIETLDDGPTIGLRESATNTVVRLWVTPVFVARTRGDGYLSADALRLNDTVVVDAFRDAAGNLIAQSIRLRNR